MSAIMNSVGTFYEPIKLSGNAIGGILPAQIGLLSMLTELNLSQNSIEGSLPLETELGGGLAALTRLRSLSCRENILTGPLTGARLPPSLVFLRLSNNRFSGPVPRIITRMAGLRVLRLDHNFLSGDVTRLPPEVEIVDLYVTQTKACNSSTGRGAVLTGLLCVSSVFMAW